MYDDSHDQLLPSDGTAMFPELDDPQFWADIAAQTGIPPTSQRWLPEPTCPVLPSVYTGQPIIVKSQLGPLSELAPYQSAPVSIYALPGSEEPLASDIASRQESSNWLMQILLWGIVMLLVGSLFGGLRGSQPTPTGSPNTSYSVLGNPSVNADFINQVLDYYGSPAAKKGQALYNLGVQYGVDPVFALAFFMNESTFGTKGMATMTLGLGNERCLADRPCVNTQGLPCQTGQSCYAQFLSWEDGFEHWYMLITGPLYKGVGLTTVAAIIPKYAPSSDHNNEAHYIAVVEYAVDAWRAHDIKIA